MVAATHAAAFALLESLYLSFPSRRNATWFTSFGDFPEVLDSLPTGWAGEVPATGRREDSRFWCDSEALLKPLDDPDFHSAPLPVRLKDISRQGVGITHREPFPYRLVEIRFADDERNAPLLVVRLQWCRFVAPGECQSGGQIQRVILPESCEAPPEPLAG